MEVLTVWLLIGIAVMCGAFVYLLIYGTDNKKKKAAAANLNECMGNQTSGTTVPEAAPAPFPKKATVADEKDLCAEIISSEPNLSDIDYVDEGDTNFVPTPETPGLEVIGIVWPEKKKNNKIYRYDPNGEIVSVGDIVLVPTFDAIHGKEMVRKGVVAKGNYREDPNRLPSILKKIIGIASRKK